MKLLVSREDDYGICIEAVQEGKLISSYRFLSAHKAHPVGSEIIKATLLSWATLDLCFAEEILIEVPLSDNIQEYIRKNFQLVCSTYSYIYHKKLASIFFTKETPPRKNLSCFLEGKRYFLGATGGRDSTLCRYLLEKAGKIVQTYKVSYDHAAHLPDGHIDMEIFNTEIYHQRSISGIKRESEIISTHQADDIHVTFAAPYFPLQEGMPATLAVGLPWESIHMLSNGIPDLVPTESFESISLLIQLFQSYGLETFNIISPIATLHSVGVYSLLGEIIGADNLRLLDSCWHSANFSGSPCACCPKCQRMKYLFKYIYDEKYLAESPFLDIKSADFLFGSLYGYEILRRFPEINWSHHALIDKTSVIFSKGFESLIQDTFKMKPFILEDFSVEYLADNQNWGDLLKQITLALGINYDDLSDTPIHSEEVSFLPFEQDYKWKRKHQILNCYSSFILDEELPLKTKTSGSQGEVHHLPALPIFKKWLRKTS